MRAPNKLKILFISAFNAPFIKDDLEYLKSLYDVHSQVGSGILQLIQIVRSCLKTDIVFCWFASTYTFIAVLMMKILHRKSIIVLGGVDVAKDEKLEYGIWLVPWKARLVRYAVRNADKIIAVDESLAEKARQLAEYDGGNIEIIPTGYDVGFWDISEISKTKCVLTVATINDEKRYCIKGIDILFEAARLLPQIEFTLIGMSQKTAIQYNVPSNVEVISTMDRIYVKQYYQKAKVYCQPSRHEGMSNALCEAMLCGCIPIATDVGATRFVLNGSGIIVPADNVDALVLAIQQGLQLSEEAKYMTRERIADRFTKTNREQKLINTLQAMWQ